MRNTKGITLVALVITIIVMLILAGVAIHLTIGEMESLRNQKKDHKSIKTKQMRRQAV